MRKSEFIAIAAAGLLASCSFYGYEKNRIEEERQTAYQNETNSKAKALGAAPDFSAITETRIKKQTFFDYLRPGIALENERVKKERKRLEAIQTSFDAGNLTSSELSDAKRLGRLYNLNLAEEGITQSWLDKMRHRVDVIPEALVLVQAANESAWGTSRFATKANNYFGQWCYSKGCGLVPLKRSEGMTHEVAKFASAQQSIHGYFMNVNRNKAYHELREIRYQRHTQGESLIDTEAAMALANGLLKYSERGEAYVNDLQSMIRHNKQFWEGNSQSSASR